MKEIRKALESARKRAKSAKWLETRLRNEGGLSWDGFGVARVPCVMRFGILHSEKQKRGTIEFLVFRFYSFTSNTWLVSHTIRSSRVI